MTIETLKSLINHAFDKAGPAPGLKDSVNMYLDLYEKELNINKPSTFGHRQLLVEQPPYNPNPMAPYCGEGTGSPLPQHPSTTSGPTTSGTVTTTTKDVPFTYTAKPKVEIH